MANKKYSDMSVDQLVKLSQKLGVQSDALRDERRAIKEAINAKLPTVAPSPDGKVAYVVPDAPAAGKRPGR